jgi:hypothetical protein
MMGHRSSGTVPDVGAGSQPRKRIQETVVSLLTSIDGHRATPRKLTIAIEAESRETACEASALLAERLNDREQLLVQAWRFTGTEATCTGSAAQILSACRARLPLPRWSFVGFRNSCAARLSALLSWIEETGWTPAMQPHFDGVLLEWLSEVGRPLVLIVEGLDESEDISRTLVQVLHVIVGDDRTITILPGKVGALSVKAWPVDLACEIPSLAPVDFDQLIVAECRSQFNDADGLLGDVERWGRVIRIASYPHEDRAVLIVNAFRQVYEQAQAATGSTVPDRDARRLFFIVLMSHRFAAFTDWIQSHADGIDALVRVIWLSLCRLKLEDVEDVEDDASSHGLGRTPVHGDAPPSLDWREYANSGEVQRFVRDCMGGDEPLVEPFFDRHVAARYIWPSATFNDVHLKYSHVAKVSMAWFKTWLKRGALTAAADPSMVREASDNGDYGLMSVLALYHSAQALLELRVSERFAKLEAAVKLAQSAVAQARRASDRGGEMRARGALAVIWMRLDRKTSAEDELKGAKLLAGDVFERTRLMEFAALCAEAAGNRDDAVKQWSAVRRDATKLGIRDLVRRSLEAEVRLEDGSAAPTHGLLPADTAIDERLGTTQPPSRRKIVAISYLRESESLAEAIVAKLSGSGLDCEVKWDRAFESGKPWKRQIYETFASADVAILLVQKEYLDSKMCMFEFNLVDARKATCLAMLVHLDDTSYNHALGDVHAIVTSPILDPQRRPDVARVPALVQLILEKVAPHLPVVTQSADAARPAHIPDMHLTAEASAEAATT